jgi:hypothetical protein
MLLERLLSFCLKGLFLSRFLDVGSLFAFRALGHFKPDFLALLEGLETIHLDCREVSEQILAAIIRSDEAETLGIVEPFDNACRHEMPFKKYRE